MSAGLQMRFDRSPDYFALSKAHAEEVETHLFLQAGIIVGIASLVIRDGFVKGRSEPVVYLCDLRIQPGRRLAGRWHKLFMQRMQQLVKQRGVRYAFTVILRENRSAHNSLLRKRRFNFEQLRGFSTVSILARKPWVKSSTKPVIRHALQSDMGSVQSFLTETNREQPLGVHFDDGTFTKRLSEWPNLTIEDFLLAFDESGTLIGCLAPWDYSALKRVVIDALPFSANVLRNIINLSAPITGRPVISEPPNAQLPDVAITHIAIADRCPDIFAALIDVAVKELFSQKRFATISLCLFDDESLWQSLRHYWYYSTPMDLYSMKLVPDTPDLSSEENRVPGFEFYLA